MNYQVKQVIVCRYKFPDEKGELRKVRTGKIVAQACHSSIAFITYPAKTNSTVLGAIAMVWNMIKLVWDKEFWLWVTTFFTKIAVSVETEDELLALYYKTTAAGLRSHIVLDSGLTEFKGVRTYTALAIGPNYVEDIDRFTKDLPLL